VFGAAVGKIIACHRRNNNVAETQSFCRLGDALRLVAFHYQSVAAGNRTEAARTRTNVAENHEGRRPPRIALRPIRTTGVFTDRFESKITEYIVGE
jgi:hypothetical protein